MLQKVGSTLTLKGNGGTGEKKDYTVFLTYPYIGTSTLHTENHTFPLLTRKQQTRGSKEAGSTDLTRNIHLGQMISSLK